VDNLKKSLSSKLIPLAQRRNGSFRNATERKGVLTMTTKRKLDLLLRGELLKKNFDSCASRLWIVRPQKKKKMKSLALKKKKGMNKYI